MLRTFAALSLAAMSLAAQTRDQRIAQLAAAIEKEVIETRRDLHMHPELSNREVRTGKLIAERLRALGFTDIRINVARHGVVALLKGSKPGPVVAWRADMDGLPVFDIIDKPYKSQNGGVKHACGHDAHVAIALGVAKVLSQMRADIPGTVKFIFQPAEEGAPAGEEGGAALMIKEGALDNPRPAAIFGLHVSSLFPTGTVNFTPGPAMASTDTYVAKIKGKQTHGAYPHLGTDPIVTAAECVMALQTIRSRRIDPLEPIVVTVGRIQGGNRSNIIPNEVELEGTIRTLKEETRENVRTMMRQTLQGCTGSGGAQFTLEFREGGYPVTDNNIPLTEESLPLLRSLSFVKTVQVRPSMGGEDFAFYQKQIPGFFWWLGVRNEAKGIVAAHHTPDFDVDEDGLVLGVRTATNQLLDYLERHSKQ